jgi:hypothetical protein
MAVNKRSKVGYGLSEALPGIFSSPIVAKRSPNGRDRAEVGQLWVNTVADETFILTSIVSGVSVWTGGGGGAGVFDSLTVNPGPVILNSQSFVDIDALAPSHFAVAGGSLTLSTLGASTNVTSDTSVVIDGGDLIVLGTNTDPGNVSIDAGVVNVAATAAILDSYCGIATFTGLTTAAAASQVITITNDKVGVTSGVICSASNLGANDAQMTVTRIENFAGSFEVTVTNNGLQALNGDLVLSFIVLQ